MTPPTGEGGGQAAGEGLDPDLHRALGLTDGEYERIVGILGRAPNRAELAMYSVMWSEHCSYKSSRIHLRTLPSEGPHVLLGPGEGAGIVEVGGVAVALRIESHNHPSYIEPVQGAQTGIGGIVRDILSMGARPIALLDPLRFGPLPVEGRTEPEIAERNRWLVDGVVHGISSYGNCIGVPTVGGEVVFDDCYSGNPLVNVMCVGVAPIERIKLARAHGPGNKVLLLGSKTGRDGIGGVSVLASSVFEAGSETKRPSVQVGDPFTEKLLIEACLELIDRGVVVGIQDLGGAGICCATSESAANAGTGMRVVLDRVPRRERGMEPFEVLTSESQERMLVVVSPADAAEALATCRRWGLDAEVIGEVTDTGRLEVVSETGEILADVPAASLGDGPVYDRPRQAPLPLPAPPSIDDLDVAPGDLAAAVLRLVGDPSLCSKRWVWEQYDHQVMLGTVAGPGRDAAVLRLPGTTKRIAVTADANGRWCAADPYLGTCHAVAEAARNLTAVGAEPIGVTNCLNFGSPERPEVMWAFAESVRGLGDACRALGTPVTGGNVSFYNESAGRSIHPTPVVGMVGIVADAGAPPLGFRRGGDLVVLLGATGAELAGSEYRRILHGRTGGLPALDLAAEAALGRVVRDAIGRGLLASSHDCSDGGLAVALAEACLDAGVGASIGLAGAASAARLAPHVWLFSETAGRMLVSLAPAHLPALEALARAEGVPLAYLGTVGGEDLALDDVAIPVAALRAAHEETLPRAMGA
ncbi:MAG TPA: phosphoribosylformylglycinamidine synthase subunit PurL [Actinomycetota bacterium]|nr:phosphoribosylformylglycinamidine synthase subunit PurL [Actinomycetota bacterium]